MISVIFSSATALMLLFASALAAQTMGVGYTIYGRVSLPDGSPASRVTVSMSNVTGLSRQVLSDDAGNYEFHDIPRGRYTLTAVNPAAPEQYSDRAEIEISRYSPSRIVTNLYLHAGTRLGPAKESTHSGVSVVEAAQRVPKAAQKEYEKAVKLGESRQLDKALQSFNRSIELFPQFFQAITERGHLRVTMGQIAEAQKDFARALELNAHYEPAMRGSGICKLRESKYADAIKDLEQAVSSEPRDASAYLFLGFAYASVDRREEARAALQKALALDATGSARAHVYLASLDIRENRNKEAIDELETYLAAVPNAPDAEKLRALLSRLKTK